ncbi:MAG: sulfotransferase family 2 domain-containing protein, partial [Pseudomonadota bacterium]
MRQSLYRAARERILPFVPRTLYAGQLVQRRKALWQDAGAIFIHVPKCGGTSVNQALYGRHIGHLYAAEIKRFAPRLFAELPTFTIIREPVERLHSAFRFAKAGRAIDAPEGVAMAARHGIPDHALADFDTFVHSWLCKRPLEKRNVVFQPQHIFVCDAVGRPMVDVIGRLDRLEPIEEFLSSSLGRRVSFPRVNVSPKSTHHVSGDACFSG